MNLMLVPLFKSNRELWRLLVPLCAALLLGFAYFSCSSFSCDPKLLWLSIGTMRQQQQQQQIQPSSALLDSQLLDANKAPIPSISSIQESHEHSEGQLLPGAPDEDTKGLSIDIYGKSEELDNGTQHGDFQQMADAVSPPPISERGQGPTHSVEVRSWVIQLQQGLSDAKHAILNAPVVSDGNALHSSIYLNLSNFLKSYDLMDKIFKVYIYKDGVRPLVHVGPTVGIYASEGRFIHHLQRSRKFVVKDPTRAHMFFLPFSVTNMVRKLYSPDSHTMMPLTNFIRGYIKRIASKYPFWNRTQGADHFFLSCHDWGPAMSRANQELHHNSIKVVCNADLTEDFVQGKDVSLPETILHSAKPPSRLGGPPPGKRPFLAFFAGHMHGRVRPILLKHWKGTDPDMKIYEEIPAATARKMSYIRHLKMSKFCICPMGYEVNSPRIVEAIYYDCVPVIIADNIVLPFSDVLKWEAFSLVVEERDVPQLKKILLTVPAVKYNTMQARLKHVRQHFMWHNAPSKYDIFHMILHSVWLRRLALAPL